MSTTSGDREVPAGDVEVRVERLTPGSAARAFLAWRTTTIAMLPLWMGLASLASRANPAGDTMDDLGWVFMSIVLYTAGVLVVVPAFAFTVGRWVDRRTATQGLGYAVAMFALCGLVFGIIVGTGILLGGDANALGVAALVAAPAIAAAAGRLLCELRGAAWSAVLWVLFAIALVPILLALGAALGGRLL